MPSTLIKLLATVQPPRANAGFTEDDFQAVSETCPAVADLLHATPTPFTDSIKTTLMMVHQVLEANNSTHVLAGLTTQTLENAETNLKEGKVDKLLADLPQLKKLMKERNSWAAGTAIAYAATHAIMIGLETTQPEQETSEEEDEEVQQVATDAQELIAAPETNRQRGLNELLNFFATLEQVGVPLDNISLKPVVSGKKGSLVVTGLLSAPVPFNLLAKLNAAVKKAWPTAPDLSFSGQAEGDITFSYSIEQ